MFPKSFLRLSRGSVLASRAMACVYAVMLLSVAVLSWLSCRSVPTYYPYEISDWLINYHGGFVRRGLAGEAMWQVWQVVHFPLKTVIVAIELLSFVLVAVKSVRVCRELRMSLFPLACIMVGAGQSLCWVRRDWLVLWLTAYVFVWHVTWLRSGRWRHWAAAQGLLTLLILMHEATVFFTVPLMAAVMWFRDDGRWLSSAKACRTLMAFLPPLAAVVATAVCKGSAEGGVAIWQSWAPAFAMYPEVTGTLPDMGRGVAVLSETLQEIVKFHINVNFEPYQSLPHCAYHVISWVALLAFTFYLSLCNPRVTLRPFAAMPVFRRRLGNLVLVQTVAMLPMLTVLSCDYGRTVMYVVVSSLFMCHALRRVGLAVCRPYGVADVVELCGRCRLLLSPWTYLAVLMLYPITAFYSLRLFVDNMPRDFFNLLRKAFGALCG